MKSVMDRRPLAVPALVLAVALFAGGCESNEAVDLSPVPGVPVENMAPATQPTPLPGANGAPIDAMVGQVNGTAIYASTVLGDDAEELARLGAELPVDAFREEARKLIDNRLRALVLESLIRGEAQRSLNEGQRLGLERLMADRREELIRRYGMGSLKLAQQNILEATGKTLSQNLREAREKLIVEHHLRQTIGPKIYVSRRDVERVYEARRSEYQPPAVRSIELIVANTEAEAESVRQKIDSGVSFIEAGTVERMDGVKGDEPFMFSQINAVIADAELNRVYGPLPARDRWWVFRVVEIDQPAGVPLVEAQTEITQQLRAEQYATLSDQYQRDLLARGSYNPISEMTALLVDIAAARYAKG